MLSCRLASSQGPQLRDQGSGHGIVLDVSDPLGDARLLVPKASNLLLQRCAAML